MVYEKHFVDEPELIRLWLIHKEDGIAIEYYENDVTHSWFYVIDQYGDRYDTVE